MADFRLERLFVMLDEPVPGLDHLKAIDPVEFAWLNSDAHAEQLGLVPLSSFMYAPFERPHWKPAANALNTVRALIALYQKWVSQGHNQYGYSNETLTTKIQVLGQVEAVLDAADTYDRRIYFAVKDLA